MKGIILAGGSGTRLYPITKGTSKQLLPIYDKPMIYYPLSVLMLAGIKEILIISTPTDLPNFERLLGDGQELGIALHYKEQPSPDGWHKPLLLEKTLLAMMMCVWYLEITFFTVMALPIYWQNHFQCKNEQKATVFGYYVNDPERYGVVDFNKQGEALSIEEKPTNPKSNYAVVGLYFYPNSVVEIAKNIKPSHRGELEITTVNQEYLTRGDLKVELMGRGYAWLDTGTHDSLIDASNYIRTIESRQGLKVACLEVIACKMGYISKQQLLKLAEPLKKNGYGQYLIERAKEL